MVMIIYDINFLHEDLISMDIFEFSDNSIEFKYYIYNRKSVSFILFKDKKHLHRILHVLHHISNGKYIRSIYSTMLEYIAEITIDDSLSIEYINKVILNDYMNDRINAKMYCRDILSILEKECVDFDKANMYEYYNHIYEFNLPVINYDKICGI